MRKNNSNASLVHVTGQLYNKAASAVLFDGTAGKRFRTIVRVTIVRRMSSITNTLQHADASVDQEGDVSFGGKVIIIIQFAGGIAGISREKIA